MSEATEKKTPKKTAKKKNDGTVAVYPYVIVRAGSKQYRVSEGDQLLIDKVEANPGDTLKNDDVLFVAKAPCDYKLGQPQVAKAHVEFEVLQQTLGEKILIRYYRRRHNSKKTVGHRQPLTRVVVKSIHV